MVSVSVGSTDTDTDTKPEAEILTDTDTDTSIGCSLIRTYRTDVPTDQMKAQILGLSWPSFSPSLSFAKKTDTANLSFPWRQDKGQL